ncbi:MAG: hypothetical protein GY810_03075 [Aureispira sp.]|nr:hypothetical protein [Aureispira sp.]
MLHNDEILDNFEESKVKESTSWVWIDNFNSVHLYIELAFLICNVFLIAFFNEQSDIFLDIDGILSVLKNIIIYLVLEGVWEIEN